MKTTHLSVAGVVLAGTYANSVFHDENDDGVLNTNFIGMPHEGYGFSNNHTYATHPASFEESHFTIDAEATSELHDDYHT
jgi:uncharacterized protein (DUF2141 family)